MSGPDNLDVANLRPGAADLAALTPLGTRSRLLDDGEQRGGFFIVLEGAVEVLDRAGNKSCRVMWHGPRPFTGDIDVRTQRSP